MGTEVQKAGDIRRRRRRDLEVQKVHKDKWVGKCSGRGDKIRHLDSDQTFIRALLQWP
jgi:hypothetical protein